MGTLIGIGVYTVSYTVFVQSESEDACTADSGRKYDIHKVRLSMAMQNNNHCYFYCRKGHTDIMLL